MRTWQGRMDARAAAWWGAAAVGALLVGGVAAGCGEGSGDGGEAGGATAHAGGSGSEVGAAASTTADSALRRLLERLQPAVERSSGLRALRPPMLARATPETLEAYLLERFQEQLPAEEAATLTAVYSRFGLVPDTLDLRHTLLELYREQVVGYYDPVVDTLFVVEDVPSGQMEAVIAHELVHALQDQHFDLDSLTRSLEGRNDRGTAAQAAIEGHATLAMVEWQLGQLSGGEVDVTGLPDLARQLGGMDLETLGEAAGLPALGEAPRVIREALVFPYVGGLAFVQRLWTEREGRPAPFGADLPASTEQVIHPGRFVGPERDAPTAVGFDAPPPSGWEEVYADGLGELETRIFLEEHLGRGERAAGAAAGWDGDAYRLLRGPGGAEALLWTSVWDAAEEAEEFAGATRAAYGARYAGDGTGRVVRVERVELEGRPGVRVLDLPPGGDPDAFRQSAAVRLDGG